VPAVSIHFHSELPRFKLKQVKILRAWLQQVILSARKTPGDLQFIFCSDQYLLNINRQFLNHDYFTDVITFDYSEGKLISGDVYLSIDRIRDNAKLEMVTFEQELHRVMVHGVLHLLGHSDKGKALKQKMRKKEDLYLSLL
jgi:probable rRNA maturation factor